MKITNLPLKPPSSNSPEYPWWIEIITTIPLCVYYFGPFESIQEAQLHQKGYVEDLIEENAQEITVEIKRCQPQYLTIYLHD